MLSDRLRHCLVICPAIILTMSILLPTVNCAIPDQQCRRIGDSLPAIALNDANGNSVNFATLIGKTVMVYVWSISCSSCQDDLKLVQKLNSDLKAASQFRIISINRSDSNQQIKDFMLKNNFDFTVLSDPKDTIFAALCVLPSVPASVLIDPQGQIKSVKWDIFRNENEMATFIGCEDMISPASYKPRITEISVTMLNANSALVRWHTEVEATGTVVLTNGRICFLGGSTDELTKDHELKVNLTAASESGPYNVEITSRNRRGNESSAVKEKALTIGNKENPKLSAPDFVLISQSGKFVHLSDFAGKKVLLHFWSYTCHVCAEELPLIQSFNLGSSKEYLELVTIAVGGDITEVNNYVVDHGYTFPVLFDSDASVDSKYKNASFPMSYMVDANGFIVSKRDIAFQSLYDIQQFTGLSSYIKGLQ